MDLTGYVGFAGTDLLYASPKTDKQSCDSLISSNLTKEKRMQRGKSASRSTEFRFGDSDIICSASIFCADGWHASPCAFGYCDHDGKRGATIRYSYDSQCYTFEHTLLRYDESLFGDGSGKGRDVPQGAYGIWSVNPQQSGRLLPETEWLGVDIDSRHNIGRAGSRESQSLDLTGLVCDERMIEMQISQGLYCNFLREKGVPASPYCVAGIINFSKIADV